MWLAPDVSYTSVFAPFYANADLPLSYQSGNPRSYDENVAWWVFDFVANWSRLNFQRMCNVDILPKQQALEKKMIAASKALDAVISKEEDPQAAINKFCFDTAEELLNEWRALGRELIAKYSDGYVNRAPQNVDMAIPIGYSANWLARTNYARGPTGYGMKIEGES